MDGAGLPLDRRSCRSPHLDPYLEVTVEHTAPVVRQDAAESKRQQWRRTAPHPVG